MDDTSDAAVTTHEGKALEHIRQSMQHRYPDLPASTIAERMQQVHRQYDNARIRGYVPLLVERKLTAQLGAATATANGTGPER